MHFGILGPIQAVEQGREFVPSAPKLRQILTLLLASPNRGVSVAEFQEEVWDTAPPRSGTAAVHTHITQLRKALTAPPGFPDSPSHRLVTCQRGYRLRVGSDELDTQLFNRRVSAGRQAIAEGQVRTGAALLGSALSLWRGSTMADVTPGPLLESVLWRQEEQRLKVLEERIDADLRLGRHHELVAETSALVHRYPTRENFTAQLMISLSRSWRRADALAAFHRLRGSLSAEHHRSPSRRIHRLYESILSANLRDQDIVDEPFRLSLDLAGARM
ncbi:MAG: AfsR/SARP family transcriptional regulator [Actinophytocola sp.]|uniref:AfsR/SARP family transcriptional regulator n=1 Tax=Actinophytocola sp. TaxID=1872138 RepID=UPI003C792B18